MLGTFQKSHLRIEIEANESVIRDSLLQTRKLKQWLLFPCQFPTGFPEILQPESTFTSWIGLIPVTHRVEVANETCLRFLLSQGIDGYHEWYWGDGWIQSRLEGISMLPLNLGQTASFLRLRQFISDEQRKLKN